MFTSVPVTTVRIVIEISTDQLIIFLHELNTEDDEDIEALLDKLGVVHDLLISQVDLIVAE